MISVVLISFLFVFAGMTVLVLLVSLLGELSFRRTRKKIKRQRIKEAKDFNAAIDKKEVKIPRDISIAISLALCLNKFIDEETQDQITIRKSTIPFSPWSTRGRSAMVADNISFFRRRQR